MAILIAIQSSAPLTSEQLQAVKRYHEQVLGASPRLRHVIENITIFFDEDEQTHSLVFISRYCTLASLLWDTILTDCGSSGEPIPLSGLNFDAQKWEQRIAELEKKYNVRSA